jgi:hypothetical protein
LIADAVFELPPKLVSPSEKGHIPRPFGISQPNDPAEPMGRAELIGNVELLNA